MNDYLFDTPVSNKSHQKNCQKSTQNPPRKSSSKELVKDNNTYQIS
jgi:hypothetical protein